MPDKSDSNYRNSLILFTVVSVALILASSVGFFDGLLSISEKAQSNYRIKIGNGVNKIDSFTDAIYDIAQVKNERDKYQKENISLLSKNSELKAKLEAYDIAELQSLSDFSTKSTLLPAEVIRYKPEEPGTMVINRGSEDGAKEGDILIFENFAIGELTDVHKYTSSVRTLKSSDSKVLVISDKGVKGVLRSRGGREFWVEEVLGDADVKAGDIFMTLGTNSNFVSNLYVGEVVDIEKTASSTTKNVKLKNELDFNNLQELYILHHEN